MQHDVSPGLPGIDPSCREQTRLSQSDVPLIRCIPVVVPWNLLEGSSRQIPPIAAGGNMVLHDTSGSSPVQLSWKTFTCLRYVRTWNCVWPYLLRSHRPLHHDLVVRCRRGYRTPQHEITTNQHCDVD